MVIQLPKDINTRYKHIKRQIDNKQGVCKQ